MYNTQHKSVLLNESLEALNIHKGGKYVDATLGAAGHTIEILALGGNVLGIDQDESMIEVARKNIESACPPDNNFVGSFTLVYSNFKDIDRVAKENNFYPVDGILMDLGVSSLHFDSTDRGFSFQRSDEPLDMRLDTNLGVTAADLLNSLDKNSLIELFNLGETSSNSYRLANKVIRIRSEKKFETISDFLKLFPERSASKNHPATKAMMALRIAVNSELNVLEESLPKCLDLLKSGGKLVVISFHSGEDRIVKNLFKQFESENLAEIITKKPLLPSDEEIHQNPRSRSAKMRVLKKI